MRRWVGEGGQATVEVALVLPLIIALVMLTAQVGLVVRNEVLVIHAAREAARAAAVTQDDPLGAARRAAQEAGPLAKERLSVRLEEPTGDRVRVEVSFEDPTDLPLIGRLLPTVRHSVATTMRRETPGI